MKRLLMMLALLGWLFSAAAQHETLFGSMRLVGAFGGPMYETGLNNDLGSSAGGGGGLVFRNFFLGGYGMGGGDFEGLLENGNIRKLEIGHGGLWMGFMVPSHKVVHLYGSARVGWGALNIELEDNGQQYDDLDKIFVLTPEVGVELNVFRWFRVTGTVSYRHVSGANESLGYKNEDLSGAMWGLGLRFGWFGWRR
ncbi:MAG: hypothetical protein ACKV1O_21945 [Saprospiraceae bacterium]